MRALQKQHIVEHAAIDHQNRLAALVFTASQHDNQVMERLVNDRTRVLVGDSHYSGSVMRKWLADALTPPAAQD